jgi:hypothetical protein
MLARHTLANKQIKFVYAHAKTCTQMSIGVFLVLANN